MGHATEHLAARFGLRNAAELIISVAALRAGPREVAKASLAGGIGRPEQKYDAAGARSQATMPTHPPMAPPRFRLPG
jgi:Ca2+:H+ antiporter